MSGGQMLTEGHQVAIPEEAEGRGLPELLGLESR